MIFQVYKATTFVNEGYAWAPDDAMSSEKKQKALKLFRESLGLSEDGTVETAPLSRKARRREKRERRFRLEHAMLLLDQNVPINEARVLRMIAEKMFWKYLRESRNNTYSGRTQAMRVVRDAAGGDLPMSAADLGGVLEKLADDLGDKIAAKNKKREALKIAKPVEKKARTLHQLKDTFDSELRRRLKACLRDAKFHVGGRSGLEYSLSAIPSTAVRAPCLAKFNEVGQRGAKKPVIKGEIRREWLRTVYNAGLAHKFGTKTIVLVVKGDRYFVAYQKGTDRNIYTEWRS